MTYWEQINVSNGPENWEELLKVFPDASPFQNYDWGEAYGGMGWTPVHLGCFEDSGEPFSAALVLTRRLPSGIGFAWCPGGPARGTYGEELGSLPEAVMRAGKFRGLFIRGRFDKKLDITDSIRLTAEGWSRSIFSMGSNYSIELDLTRNEEELAAGLSGNWKRNLRKSQKNGLSVEKDLNPDPAEIRQLYREMEKIKGLAVLCSEDKLSKVFNRNHTNFIYVACRDKDGKLLGFRSALLQGPKGVDYLAATSVKGRDLRVSFFAMWEMIKFCRSAGVTTLDLGGIDPIENPGVYRFKSGLGGKPVEFLGEWDWAGSNWLRYAGNAFLASRQSFGRTKTPRKKKPKRGFSHYYHAAARIFGS